MGGAQGGSGGDAGEDAFGFGEFLGGGEGFVVGYG